MNAAFAFGIDGTALADGVWHIGGAFFIEPKEADFVDEFGEKQIEEPAMIISHHKNVRGFFEEILGDRLAAELREFHSLGGEHIDGVAAGWLTVTRAEAGGLGRDVSSIRCELPEKCLCHRAPAHIAGANKEDMAIFLTHAMRGTLVPRATKSNARNEEIHGVFVLESGSCAEENHRSAVIESRRLESDGANRVTNEKK